MRFLRSLPLSVRTPRRAVLRRWLYPSRLMDAPRVLVDAEDGERVALRGVVCSVCAVRTRQALESVPGVESVEVDLARSEARVRYTAGTRPDEAVLQNALDQVVVGSRIRRRIEHAAHGWRSRRSGA